jgi:hypothetical protein
MLLGHHQLNHLSGFPNLRLTVALTPDLHPSSGFTACYQSLYPVDISLLTHHGQLDYDPFWQRDARQTLSVRKRASESQSR